ncbi:hypothetical protein WBP07_22935 (plasmid) [Novosphingobium sp. BL-8A]|uniref:hypothetical protein n=1 Tax=Novosphingobium sp. BL-8A TaxID=3127639 RepID=UPI0037572042
MRFKKAGNPALHGFATYHEDLQVSDGIPVFQDMTIRVDKARRLAFADLIVRGANSAWTYDAERSESANEFGGDDEAFSFVRQEGDGLKAAGLLLWENVDGYKVMNIVPEANGRLTASEYNALLADFRTRVADPVAKALSCEIEYTRAVQDLEDWMSEDAARALRHFSNCANKSTGTGHPLDERRWFDFLIIVHRSGATPDGDLLRRWLTEAESWDAEIAWGLASDLEKGLGLLARYDGH